MVKDISVTEGVATIGLSSSSDTVLKVGGEAITPTSVAGDRSEYVVTIPLEDSVNYLNVTATKAGKSYSLKLNLGGKNVVVNASTLTSFAKVLSGGEISVDTIEEMNALKIAYNANEKQIAQLEVASLNVDENVNNVIINVYSYADGALDLNILSKCERAQQFIEADKVTLQKGWNRIVIPVTAFNCSNYGKLATLRFNLSCKTEAAIAIGNIEIGG